MTTMTTNVVYEVNVFVQRGIETEYRAWLAGHIREILALPGFLRADCFDVEQDGDKDEIAICMQYHLDSRASLDDYLSLHAPRLRADGIAHFGDRFRACRRVLANATRFQHGR